MFGFVLILAILTSLALADVEPYYASEVYEQGSFGHWPQQTYRSSSLVGPILNYLQRGDRCNDGKYTMITPRGSSIHSPGPMIIDQDGSLVWNKYYGPTYDLKVNKFKGESYLTFWVGDDKVVGHGSGIHYMLDSSYNEAFKVRGANGRSTDLHELRITHDDTAVITVYEIVPANLTSANGPEAGWIWDSMLQEVNIETGDLLFEWRASDHFDFDEANRPREGEGEDKERPWDFFHINSVDKDMQGNYLISSRYMSCISYINGTTGAIIWKLGGKRNMFHDLSGGAATNISWQHDARFHGNGSAITLFDNASRGPDAPMHISRGLYLDLDSERMIVQVRHEYWNPRGLSSRSQGSVQVLDSGNVMVGYGIHPAWTEYSMDGEVLCDVHFGPESEFGSKNIISYRTFKHPWVGRPKTNPDITLDENTTYVSWNGATEVVTWVLEGADSKDAEENNYYYLTSRPKKGFETVIPIPEDNMHRYIRALALDATNNVLGSTTAVKWELLRDSNVDTGQWYSTSTGWLWFFVVTIILFICLLAIGMSVICRREGGKLRKNPPNGEEIGWQSTNLNRDGSLNEDEVDLLVEEDRDLP